MISSNENSRYLQYIRVQNWELDQEPIFFQTDQYNYGHDYSTAKPDHLIERSSTTLSLYAIVPLSNLGIFGIVAAGIVGCILIGCISSIVFNRKPQVENNKK